MSEEDRSELDELVATVIERAKERRQPISYVVQNGVMDKVNGEVRLHLARVGLAYMANNAWHKSMNGGGGRIGVQSGDAAMVGPASTANPGHPHPRDEGDILRRVWLAVPSGDEQLPAIEINVQDWKQIASEFRGVAHGWQRKADLAETAAKHCEAGEVERLADLPKRKLAIVRKEFEEVWGAS